jgi:hypothetical protein
VSNEVTNFVSAWIEECEPRKLGPAFTAAKSDLIALFAKLFKQVEDVSIDYGKTQKGMDPKFTLTPKLDQFNTYTLTVRFTYHRFPITYDFHLEPIPSPQEFIRDNVIKPLLFTTLRLSKQLDETKLNSKLANTEFPHVDPKSREVQLATRVPYAPMHGTASTLLEAYFKLQLDQSVFETEPEDFSSSTQTTDRSSQRGHHRIQVKQEQGKETWKLDPIRTDTANSLVLDLRYDVGIPYHDATPSSVETGSSETMNSGSGGANTSLPTGLASLDDEIAHREEMAAAAAIEERLAKKKRKREAQDAFTQEKRPKRFL